MTNLAKAIKQDLDNTAPPRREPLWSDDKIILAARGVRESPSPYPRLRAAAIVDLIRLVRDDYEAALAALDEQPQMAHGDLREALAKYAHEAWSGWMKYLFEKGGTLERVGTYEDGKDAYVFTITMYSVERWMRQMCTPYAELSEQEKESDRKEADEMIAIMRLAAPPIVAPEGEPPQE